MNIVQFITTLFILWFVLLLFPLLLRAQDSLALKTSRGMQFSAVDNHNFQLRKFIVPTALIAYGASSFAIPKMTGLFRGGEQRQGQTAFIPYIGPNRFGINAVRSF